MESCNKRALIIGGVLLTLAALVALVVGIALTTTARSEEKESDNDNVKSEESMLGNRFLNSR